MRLVNTFSKYPQPISYKHLFVKSGDFQVSLSAPKRMMLWINLFHDLNNEKRKFKALL